MSKFWVTRLFVRYYHKYARVGFGGGGNVCIMVHPVYMLQLFENTVTVIIEL